MSLDLLREQIQYTESLLSNTAGRTEHIYQDPGGWVIEYPEFAKLADEQMHTFWPWDEPKVENDLQDLRVKVSHAEREGILHTLKLFTHYERRAGDDFWAGRIMATFKRPEIQRMSSMFSAVEFNSHAGFYNKVNEVLFVDNLEFYNEWKNDPVLVDRMDMIGSIIDSDDDLISIGGFTFVEGAILYSNFAYLKHYQVQECGKDAIKNTCRGINLSVGDENTHAIGGAGLYKRIKEQRRLSSDELGALNALMRKIAMIAYEHECHIIDTIFGFGHIDGITANQMKEFVKHRIDLCLMNLEIDPLFSEDGTYEDEFVKSWFYSNINALQFHDFFTGGGSEYHINWNRKAFGDVWRKNAKSENSESVALVDGEAQ